MIRIFVLLLSMAAVSMPLAACGKKGSPQPPSGGESEYPRQYPAPE